jgi:hypothetical protein
MRKVHFFLPIALLASASAAQVPATVSSWLIIFRNPDYGELTPADLNAAQACKDAFLADVSRLSQPMASRRSRRAFNANAPNREAATIVAAAINTCVAARGLEGLHVLPADVPLRGALLR